MCDFLWQTTKKYCINGDMCEMHKNSVGAVVVGGQFHTKSHTNTNFNIIVFFYGNFVLNSPPTTPT